MYVENILWGAITQPWNCNIHSFDTISLWETWCAPLCYLQVKQSPNHFNIQSFVALVYFYSSFLALWGSLGRVPPVNSIDLQYHETIASLHHSVYVTACSLCGKEECVSPIEIFGTVTWPWNCTVMHTYFITAWSICGKAWYKLLPPADSVMV